MTGYGLSVFRGSVPERFGVEVIGIQRNVSPGRARIYVRVSGQGLEESGVVAGMSGSPIYLGGRLAGALAIGWDFSKSPIAGVTPIEAMLGLEGEAETEVPAPRRSGGSDRVLFRSLLPLPGEPEEARYLRLEAATRDLLALPLPHKDGAGLLSPVAAGFPSATLERFRGALKSLGLPVPASATPAVTGKSDTPEPSPLRPGSSLAVLLVEGDLELAGVGTVTHVFPGGRFLAFGHPLLGLGALDLPAASADVLTILPSYFQSFKIASPLASTFRLTRDADAGVAGASDGVGKTVPVAFRFESDDTKQARKFAFRIASHPRLLPTLLAMSSDAALRSVDQTPPDRTLWYRVALRTGSGDVVWTDTSAGPRSREIALLSAVLLATTVVDNDFSEPEIQGIEMDFRSRPGERKLKILDAAASKRKAAPGETIAVAVRLAGRRVDETIRTLRLSIPLEAPEGKASIVVADGSTATALRMGADPAEPRSLADVRRFISRISPSDRLSVLLSVPSRGAVTGDRTLSSLPPSVVGLLSQRRSGQPIGASVDSRLLSEVGVTLGEPVSGSVRLELEIEKPRN